ncbi:exopolysaccharide biosynthesis protein [Oceanibacterium hippocampi]|uniref:Exopolysaccharide synthesis, ExoD n=1 Tax=Oceanibacterium hippocampi TaxID=745714 RepID=A0A1Y5TV23_9PROT|nr:exopolysaccharide biosynthesis protein [Oceanibacterium hippocampi]SLN73835.1 Exopolysaccharide synthesis, ExoD [Oceanibacterium hippocampi]
MIDVADRVSEASEGEHVSVDAMIGAVGKRAFGPLLLVFSLIALSPVGAIPGATILLGALIILVAGQVLLGRQTPWIPGRLLRIEVASERARRAIGRIKPWLARVDRIIRPRWPALLEGPSRRVVALICVVLAMLMYPLALVPGGAAVPALAIAILSLGISAFDGLLLAVGLAISGASFALAGYFLL